MSSLDEIQRMTEQPNRTAASRSDVRTGKLSDYCTVCFTRLPPGGQWAWLDGPVCNPEDVTVPNCFVGALARRAARQSGEQR